MVSQDGGGAFTIALDRKGMASSSQAAPERPHSIASFDDDFMMHRFKVGSSL